MPINKPRLIITNQFVTPGFIDWLKALAESHGPLELWSGNAPDHISDKIVIRHAPAYDRSTSGSRLRTWLHFSGVVTAALLRRGDPTPLLAVTNPPFMPLVAWLLHHWQRRPFGLLEYDIYPNILTPLGQTRPSHPLYRLWRSWHGQALRSAQLVITLGVQMAQVLRTLAGTTHLPVEVIPNWIDTDWIKPVPRHENPFAQQHELGDKLIVLYSGNLGATHAIETIIAVAGHLQDNQDIQFLIIGEGAKKPLVETAIRTGRTPTLQLLPLQPARMLPFTLTSADVAIVTLADGYEGLSMPSKTYSMLAAGNAVLGISRAPNDLAATIEAHGCGVNFAPENVAAIAAWLTSLATDRSQLAQLQSRARQAAVEHYHASHCFARLNQVIEQLLLNGDGRHQPLSVICGETITDKNRLPVGTEESKA